TSADSRAERSRIGDRRRRLPHRKPRLQHIRARRRRRLPHLLDDVARLGVPHGLLPDPRPRTERPRRGRGVAALDPPAPRIRERVTNGPEPRDVSTNQTLPGRLSVHFALKELTVKEKAEVRRAREGGALRTKPRGISTWLEGDSTYSRRSSNGRKEHDGHHRRYHSDRARDPGRAGLRRAARAMTETTGNVASAGRGRLGD